MRGKCNKANCNSSQSTNRLTMLLTDSEQMHSQQQRTRYCEKRCERMRKWEKISKMATFEKLELSSAVYQNNGAITAA